MVKHNKGEGKPEAAEGGSTVPYAKYMEEVKASQSRIKDLELTNEKLTKKVK